MPHGDNMRLLCKYDVAPYGHNDAILASMCCKAHIIHEANIIEKSTC